MRTPTHALELMIELNKEDKTPMGQMLQIALTNQVIKKITYALFREPLTMTRNVELRSSTALWNLV